MYVVPVFRGGRASNRKGYDEVVRESQHLRETRGFLRSIEFVHACDSWLNNYTVV
jgi:hypothetical protein